MRRPRAPAIGLGLLLVFAAGYWLWVGLTQRSIVEDDGISILVGQSILRHGVPQLPSGLLYHRSYLPHYLLAGSMALFGPNDLGIMVPSLLLGLGVLCLVFLVGRDVLGRPWAGLTAAALLMALQAETFYATSPRMYMALQGFSLLAAYWAWRGFVCGERAFQWPTALAIAAALFSHQQGGALLLALPAAVLAARWRRPAASRAPVPWRPVLAGWAALWGVFYGTSLYKPSTAIRPIPSPEGQIARFLQVNLDVDRWLAHVQELERTVPLGILLAPLVLWAVLTAMRRNTPSRQGVVFLAALTAVCAFAMVAATRTTLQRFWFGTLPPYVLLLVVSPMAAREGWAAVVRGSRRSRIARRWLAAAGLGGWLLLIGTAVDATVGFDRYAQRIRSGYGVPCAEGECMASTRQAYRRLRETLGADDLVIAANSWTTAYYLGRVDGVLSEARRADGRFVPFTVTTERYFGIPLIDTAEELEGLRAGSRRVWVVTDHKVERQTSPETRGRLASRWMLALSLDRVRVYCNRADAL